MSIFATENQSKIKMHWKKQFPVDIFRKTSNWGCLLYWTWMLYVNEWKTFFRPSKNSRELPYETAEDLVK